jgi:hypothetical protein
VEKFRIAELHPGSLNWILVFPIDSS